MTLIHAAGYLLERLGQVKRYYGLHTRIGREANYLASVVRGGVTCIHKDNLEGWAWFSDVSAKGNDLWSTLAN